MIAVIADDFTGAAEIGGIGLRHGLKVVIETNVNETKDCDLLIIAADTRSRSPEIAAIEIEEITRQLQLLNPRFIYKKLDSVLRGNIDVELFAQMAVMQKKRAIIVAGNPSLERLIKNGIYYIKGQALADSFFSNDSEFPITSSSVVEIINRNKGEVWNCKVDQDLPETGLIIGDVYCDLDLNKWNERIDEESVIAGGAGFFNVVLKKFFPSGDEIKENKIKVRNKSLFVLGSMYPKSEELLKRMENSNIEQMNMPEDLFKSKIGNVGLIEDWARDVTQTLEAGKNVVVMVNHTSINGNGISSRVKENIGLLVANIFHKAPVKDLLIEGGATTSEILKNLNINKLYPFNEIDLGVIQMKVDAYPELCITTKPGSYNWPDDVWVSNELET